MLKTGKQVDTIQGRVYESINVFASKADMADICNGMHEKGYDFMYAFQNGALITLMFRQRGSGEHA